MELLWGNAMGTLAIKAEPRAEAIDPREMDQDSGFVSVPEEIEFVGLKKEEQFQAVGGAKGLTGGDWGEEGPFLCAQCGATLSGHAEFLEHLWQHDSEEAILGTLTDLEPGKIDVAAEEEEESEDDGDLLEVQDEQDLGIGNEFLLEVLPDPLSGVPVVEESHDRMIEDRCKNCGCKRSVGSDSWIRDRRRFRRRRRTRQCTCLRGRLQASSGPLLRLRSLRADPRLFPCFACPRCRHKYLFERVLKRKLFGCNDCGYVCSIRSQLSHHFCSPTPTMKELGKEMASVKEGKEEEVAARESRVRGLEESRGIIKVEVKEEAREFSCSYCDYRRESEAAVTLHERIHANERPYNCFYCGFMAAHRVTMESHMASRHSGGVRGGAGLGRRPTQTPGYPKHIPLATVFDCPRCDFSTVHKRYFKLHESAQHEGEEPFRCDHCVFTSVGKGALEKHIRARHSVKVPRGSSRVSSAPFTSSGPPNTRSNRGPPLPIHMALLPVAAADHNYSLPGGAVAGGRRVGAGLGGGVERRRRFRCPHCSFSTALVTTLKVHESMEHGVGPLREMMKGPIKEEDEDEMEGKPDADSLSLSEICPGDGECNDAMCLRYSAGRGVRPQVTSTPLWPPILDHEWESVPASLHSMAPPQQEEESIELTPDEISDDLVAALLSTVPLSADDDSLLFCFPPSPGSDIIPIITPVDPEAPLTIEEDGKPALASSPLHSSFSPQVKNFPGSPASQTSSGWGSDVEPEDRNRYVCSICGFTTLRRVDSIRHQRCHVGTKGQQAKDPLNPEFDF